MNILKKAGNALRILREDGFRRILFILATEYSIPIPLSAKSNWTAGIKLEVQFWDAYFRTKGLQWHDTYKLRFDSDLPLQPRPANLLPVQNDARILDVGAGPLTWLGKKHEGKSINITAIDPLADEYDRILEKYRIHPLVRTEKLAAENLMERFPADSFGLVFARNCIDHSFDPEKAILQMINVVETGGYVLLEHRPNEAENENYSGLHQWNFSMSPEGNFLISSKNDTVDMTRKYQGICIISSEIVYEYGDIDWLIVRIKKK